MLAVPADALVQRLYKILVGPRTNAGVHVGCDVRRIERAEGQREGHTPCKRLAARDCVAGDAVGGGREILAPRHHICSGDARRSAGWIAATVIRQLNTSAASKVSRSVRPQTEPADGAYRQHQDR